MQTFTPRMQPTVAKVSNISPRSETKKACGRRNSLGNHEQENFSIELWKKAFIDARERLCPLRAAGHQCGCLSVLVRLVWYKLSMLTIQASHHLVNIQDFCFRC